MPEKQGGWRAPLAGEIEERPMWGMRDVILRVAERTDMRVVGLADVATSSTFKSAVCQWELSGRKGRGPF